MALFSAYRNDKQKINKWYEKFGKNDSRHIIFYPEVILYFILFY